MSKRFNPNTPFDTAFKLLKPVWSKSMGVPQKTFPDPASVEQVRFCSFKTYGGTEGWNNDIYTIIDTAHVQTWFDPDITADCQIYLCKTGEVWDIISRPENINGRDQFMQFKIQIVKGKP